MARSHETAGSRAASLSPLAVSAWTRLAIAALAAALLWLGVWWALLP